jgi:hypothetical protein
MSEQRDKKKQQADKDKLQFILGPNDSHDDPSRLAFVDEWIRRSAQQAGLTVGTPGAIAPDAQEDEERAKQITALAAPAMAKETREAKRTGLRVMWKGRNKKKIKITRGADGKETITAEQTDGPEFEIDASVDGILDLAGELKDWIKELAKSAGKGALALALKVGRWGRKKEKGKAKKVASRKK